MSRHFARLALTTGVIAMATPALAIPMHFGNNAYELILVSDPYSGNNNSWATASNAATSSTYLGVSGHLATITSLAEQNFLYNSVAIIQPVAFAGAWLGGTGPGSWLVGPETGTAMTYTNWNGVEPNNASYAYMNIGNRGSASATPSGKWFDDSAAFAGLGIPHPNADPVIGYFVEYEAISVVPLPPTLALLGAGLGALALFGRRQKQSLAG